MKLEQCIHEIDLYSDFTGERERDHRIARAYAKSRELVGEFPRKCSPLEFVDSLRFVPDIFDALAYDGYSLPIWEMDRPGFVHGVGYSFGEIGFTGHSPVMFETIILGEQIVNRRLRIHQLAIYSIYRRNGFIV